MSRPGRRTVLIRAGGLLAALALLGAWLLAPTSATAGENSTQAPFHAVPQVSLNLLGGSGEGYAVQMLTPVPGHTWDLYTGTDHLTRRAYPVPADLIGEVTWLGVVGQQAGWVLDHPGTITRYEMHRVNVITGTDTELGTVTTRPIAFTADSWLGWSGNDLVATRFDDGSATTLARPGRSPGRVELADDALVVRSENDAHTETYLDLVEFGNGRVTRVATEPAIADFGVSATSIFWTGPTIAGEPQAIRVRDRSDGTVFGYSETDDAADSVHRVAGEHGMGYVIAADNVWRLRTISTTGTVSTVVLPDDSGGLIADGPRYLVGAGGRTGDAGVYAVAASTLSRVATVDAPDLPVTALAMAAGRVYSADDYFPDDGRTPLGARPPMAVWSRPVTGLGRPVLGDETRFPYRTGYLDGSAQSMDFSAGRGVISGVLQPARFTWRLLDRGRLTGSVTQAWWSGRTQEIDTRHPDASGPFVLAAGHVYDPAGTRLYSRPGASTATAPATGQDDLYGPRLIYSRAAARPGHEDIWLRDLDRPRSRSNPGKLAAVKVSGAKVAIWGDTVAYQSGPREITLRAATVRRFRTTGVLTELTLGEGTLAWNVGTRTYLVDTRNNSSRPAAYPGSGTLLHLDDHYLARRVTSGALVVYRSFYTEKYRPRLIGTYAPAGFTPDGDGRADTWSPQFDLSKPVTAVRLLIRSTKTGSVLRTLNGTGPDGSVRDLTFDGLSGSGRSLAAGTYRWELEASATDGEGAAVGIRGERTLTGTVRISRAGPPAR